MSDQNTFDASFTEKTKQRFASQRDTFNKKTGDLKKKYPVRFWMFAGGVATLIFLLIIVGVQGVLFDHTENYLRLEAQQDEIATVELDKRAEAAREYKREIERINCGRVDQEFTKECESFQKDSQRFVIALEEETERNLKSREEQEKKSQQQREQAEEQRIAKEALETDINAFETFKEVTLTTYDKTSTQQDIEELVVDSAQFFSAKQPQERVDLINRAARNLAPVMKAREAAINFECPKTSDEQKEICRFLVEDIEKFEAILDKFFDSSNTFRFSPSNLSDENYTEIGEAFGAPKRGVTEILK